MCCTILLWMASMGQLEPGPLTLRQWTTPLSRGSSSLAPMLWQSTQLAATAPTVSLVVLAACCGQGRTTCNWVSGRMRLQLMLLLSDSAVGGRMTSRQPAHTSELGQEYANSGPCFSGKLSNQLSSARLGSTRLSSAQLSSQSARLWWVISCSHSGTLLSCMPCLWQQLIGTRLHQHPQCLTQPLKAAALGLAAHRSLIRLVLALRENEPTQP